MGQTRSTRTHTSLAARTTSALLQCEESLCLPYSPKLTCRDYIPYTIIIKHIYLIYTFKVHRNAPVAVKERFFFRPRVKNLIFFFSIVDNNSSHCVVAAGEGYYNYAVASSQVRKRMNAKKQEGQVGFFF